MARQKIILETEMSLEDIKDVLSKNPEVSLFEADEALKYIQSNQPLHEHLAVVEGEYFFLDFDFALSSFGPAYRFPVLFVGKILPTDRGTRIVGEFDETGANDIVTPILGLIFSVPLFYGLVNGLITATGDINWCSFGLVLFVAVILACGGFMYRIQGKFNNENAYKLMLKLLKATDISENEYAKSLKRENRFK